MRRRLQTSVDQNVISKTFIQISTARHETCKLVVDNRLRKDLWPFKPPESQLPQALAEKVSLLEIVARYKFVATVFPLFFQPFYFIHSQQQIENIRAGLPRP